MAALGQKVSVSVGQPFKLNGATVVSGTGTLDFGVVGPSNKGDFSAVFQVIGTITTLTVDLQISLDGGVTFNNLSAALLTSGAPVKVLTPIIAGATYRLNITAASGSQDFWVCIN